MFQEKQRAYNFIKMVKILEYGNFYENGQIETIGEFIKGYKDGKNGSISMRMEP